MGSTRVSSPSPVRLVPHDPSWPDDFERVAVDVRRALGDCVVAVHHIGSTSIPAVAYAKPVIDVLVEVGVLRHVDERADRLIALGYEARGEYGIAGRRYFVRPEAPARCGAHVHTYRVGDERVRRHLDFRDHLRSHPAEAEGYSALKLSLAEAHPSDKERYQAGKADFIARVEERASRWRRPR